MKINSLLYQIVDKANITPDITQIFIEQITKQEIVTVSSIDKFTSCCRIVFCYANNELIGKGG